jgi:hypothetical protein
VKSILNLYRFLTLDLAPRPLQGNSLVLDLVGRSQEVLLLQRRIGDFRAGNPIRGGVEISGHEGPQQGDGRAVRAVGHGQRAFRVARVLGEGQIE